VFIRQFAQRKLFCLLGVPTRNFCRPKQNHTAYTKKESLQGWAAKIAVRHTEQTF